MSEQKTNKKTRKWQDPTDNDIVELLVVKKGVPIGDDGEVSVVEEVIESKRYNRQDYINSFRDDVGILNILKKCNAGLINPATLAASGETFTDISQVPTDIGDALQLVEDAHKLYAQLPDALKAGLDFNTFCKTFDKAKFDSFIASQKENKENVK